MLFSLSERLSVPQYFHQVKNILRIKKPVCFLDLGLVCLLWNDLGNQHFRPYKRYDLC